MNTFVLNKDMARILGLDYGLKKCGVSATDELQIIATSVGTIETKELLGFFKKYLKEEKVEKLVIGKPSHKDGSDTYLQEYIDKFVIIFSGLYPGIVIDFQDESYTSIQAKQIILDSGIKKSKRRDKTLVDKISAVLILQRYLGHI